MVEASHQPAREPVALVLAGGGARGAYELGALSVLLPELPKDERPDIILGTSVGAINAAYLAATADQWPANLERSLEEGLQLWRRLMRWRSVVKPLGSWAQIKLLLSAVADGLGVPGAHSWSLLDPGPLRESLDVHLPLERVRVNVENDAIRTAAVVATRASTSLSVALCVTDDHIPDRDLRRGIQYVPVEELCLDHVLASAAIPGAFPAVSLTLPGQPAHWFSDGGTRLNTPIKPALELGAKRVIIVALQSPRLGACAHGVGRPEVVDGASELSQAIFVDPLVNDIHTLATLNRLASPGATKSGGRPLQRIPYILIAPGDPYEVGRRATRAYQRRYTGGKNLARRCHSVARLGRLLEVGANDVRGELFSYLFFDPEFAEELIELGRADAKRWLDAAHRGEHGIGLWRTAPLFEDEPDGRSAATDRHGGQSPSASA